MGNILITAKKDHMFKPVKLSNYQTANKIRFMNFQQRLAAIYLRQTMFSVMLLKEVIYDHFNHYEQNSQSGTTFMESIAITYFSQNFLSITHSKSAREAEIIVLPAKYQNGQI